MSKEKISEIVRKKGEIEKDLEDFKSLKERAYQVFGYGINTSLANIQKSYEKGAWHELIMWNDHHDMHQGYFHFSNARSVIEAFQKVNSAVINREEFKNMLQGSCVDIGNYITQLSDQLQQLEMQLEKAYEVFVEKESGNNKWVFEQPFVKDFIFKFMSSETETE